jgi:hypothetical protein
MLDHYDSGCYHFRPFRERFGVEIETRS